MPPILLLTAALLFVAPAQGVTAKTTRASVSSSEVEGDNNSFAPVAISATGRFTAFESFASNLVPSDLGDHGDVFVRDRVNGRTARVSLNSAEKQGNGGSQTPSISASGRFVAFTSDATNLVKGDTNGLTDIFVRDRKTGKTTRVDVKTNGKQARGGVSFDPAISGDGRFVAFYSEAKNLVNGDTNGVGDVFVRDRVAHTTRRVSVRSNGNQVGLGATFEPGISRDGRFVVFSSNAPNLVPNDGNGDFDIFVHNLQSGRTVRVSVSSSEAEGHGLADRPALSADGRFVVFESGAEDLVGTDSNGQDDVFIRDRKNGTTSILSVSTTNVQSDGLSRFARVSAGGRYVVYMSDSTTFVPEDTDPGRDIYMRDRKLGTTTLLSVDNAGTHGDDASIFPVISADGRFVAFSSAAQNLVANDLNGTDDVFLRGPLH
jgi:Tol biopolymer transport system component